ncbi:hypothetical protein GCM10028784_35640 [Myceligenerans cantabricum]
MALIDHQTQRAAAEYLGISSSAISGHITALERKVTGPLFERIQKTWRATLGAREAESAARAAVTAYDAAVLAVLKAPVTGMKQASPDTPVSAPGRTSGRRRGRSTPRRR